MTSYFEIGGHIVETQTTLKSSLPLSRISTMQSRKVVDSRIVGEEARSSSRTASLSEHWFKTSFYVLRELGELDRRQQIYFLKNPYHFAGWGIGKHLEVIQMHWDYNKQRQAEWRGE